MISFISQRAPFLLGIIALFHSPLGAATPSTVDPHTIVSQQFLMGQFNARKHASFIKINKKYASRSGMYMQKLPYEAFRAMHADAKQSGITLRILSASRSFNHQKSIWEAKWNGERKVGGIRNIKRSIKNPTQRALKILEYSSMPGSSRHHWGTDIDLNSFTNSYFEKGKGKKEVEVYDSEAELKELKLGRGVETMYRSTYRTHINLSSIADNKANIMLSINAIIVSITVSTLVPNFSDNPKLIIPTLILLFV